MVLAMLNTQQYNLLAAIQQVDNITKLTKDNDWQEFIYSHLTPIKFELKDSIKTVLLMTVKTMAKKFRFNKDTPKVVISQEKKVPTTTTTSTSKHLK